jgi:hypothetical protein
VATVPPFLAADKIQRTLAFLRNLLVPSTSNSRHSRGQGRQLR